MTKEELNNLEKLAKSARPWSGETVSCVYHPDGSTLYQIGLGQDPIDEEVHRVNFIAALSPDVVLQLVEEVKRLRKFTNIELDIANEDLSHEKNVTESLRAQLKIKNEVRDILEDTIIELRTQVAEAKEVIKSWVNILECALTRRLQSGQSHPWLGQARTYLEKWK